MGAWLVLAKGKDKEKTTAVKKREGKGRGRVIFTTGAPSSKKELKYNVSGALLGGEQRNIRAALLSHVDGPRAMESSPGRGENTGRRDREKGERLVNRGQCP